MNNDNEIINQICKHPRVCTQWFWHFKLLTIPVEIITASTEAVVISNLIQQVLSHTQGRICIPRPNVSSALIGGKYLGLGFEDPVDITFITLILPNLEKNHRVP
jgi:hypothetical protein